MSYNFGKTSKERLATCHPDLQKVMNEAIKHMDLIVLCGVRSKIDQEIAKDAGASKVSWPNSMHNLQPGRNSKYSLAIDIAPYPIDWSYLPSYYYMAGIIMTSAKELGIKLRWGGCWKQDNNFKLNKFNDLVHFELVDYVKE